MQAPSKIEMSREEVPAAAPHRTRVESQTWGNTPPYAPCTLHRATCSTCDFEGMWSAYRFRAERDAAHHATPQKRKGTQ